MWMQTHASFIKQIQNVQNRLKIMFCFSFEINMKNAIKLVQNKPMFGPVVLHSDLNIFVNIYHFLWKHLVIMQCNMEWCRKIYINFSLFI